MNCFSAMVLAVLLLATMTAAKTELVGLRILYNLGLPEEGSYCSPGELQEVQQQAYDAVLSTVPDEASDDDGGDDRRELLSYICQTFCQSFPPGQCWLAYPSCTGRRLEANQERLPNVRGSKPNEGEMLEQDVEIIFDTQAGRSLGDKTYINELLDQCNKEIDAVIALLQGGVEGFSDACNALLEEHVDFACFKVPQ